MFTRLLVAFALVFACAAPAADWWDAPWTKAHERGPLSADETRAFMRELAQYVFDHHLKRDAQSPQRGMVYEYFNPKRAGQPDQWIQGEALDTMHDGAWFAAALVNAHRATGDRYYRDLLTQWVLPFYLKMLNHSDELFSPEGNNAATDANVFNREHLLQKGEKGFVPYWWDDGASVSLEMAVKKRSQLNFMGRDEFAAQGEPNPQFKLRGYSHGSSNHLAQDLAIMLQLAWLMLHDSALPVDQALAAEVAEAAKNLHQCRMNHHGHINGICAVHGLCNQLPDELARATDGLSPKLWTPDNHYVNCLVNFKPGQRVSTPGFADDQEYLYYAGTARHGTLPRPLAFKLIYDAFTTPQLFRYYCDDWDVPPGLNRFDLHPYYFKDGKPEDYRSDRKGPGKGPRPAGSRLGPQNMVVAGWALQALRDSSIWETAILTKEGRTNPHVRLYDPVSPLSERERSERSTRIGKLYLGMQFGDLQIYASSSRAAVEIRTHQFTNKKDALTVKLFSAPNAKGSFATVTLNKNGVATARNDKGELLKISPQITPLETGFDFSFVLPCTTTKEQSAWANVMEHGQHSIQIGNEVQNFFFVSEVPQVLDWLERELGRGLRTWQALFKEQGYLPTGLGAGGMGGGYAWDDMSDAGGYAHLLSAASQWLRYLEGKRDWESPRTPKP